MTALQRIIDRVADSLGGSCDLASAAIDRDQSLHSETILPSTSSGPDMTQMLSDDEMLAIFDHLGPKELLRTAALVCKRW